MLQLRWAGGPEIIAWEFTNPEKSDFLFVCLISCSCESDREFIVLIADVSTLFSILSSAVEAGVGISGAGSPAVEDVGAALRAFGNDKDVTTKSPTRRLLSRQCLLPHPSSF